MRFRLLKWISLGLAALVGLMVIAVLVIVWVVEPNSFKSRIESAVRDATGRELRLVGDIDLGFFPWLALRTGDGSFGNASGFGEQPMVTWKRAQLGAKLLPLLRGQLVADRVVLEGADIRLVRHADGHANWEGMGGGAPADPQAERMELRIDGIEVRESRISFVDESVPRSLSIESLNLATDEIAPGKPYTDTRLSGVLHMDGFAPEGVPFSVAVPEAVLPDDLGSIAVKEFALSFGAFEAQGGVQGTLSESPKITGTFESNSFDPRALLASLGVQAPKTTDPRALTRLQFKAAGRFDAGAIVIDPFTLTLDDTHFNGSFNRAAGDNPRGEFKLRGDSLDVARYLPPSDPDSEPFVLPTAELKRLQFDGLIELSQATMGDILMKGVTLRLLLDDQGLRSAAAPPTP